jgi:hypothetical protein
MPVRPSVRMEKLGFHWTDFHEIWQLNIFQKMYPENSNFIQSDKKRGTLYKDQYVFLVTSCLIHLRMTTAPESFVDRIKIHILSFINFFNIRAVCEMCSFIIYS